VLLPLPDETNEPATREAVELAGQYLFRDLCAPLGRTADLARAGKPAPPWESRGLYYQTFGLFQLSWPRQEACDRAARQLCQELVQRWMSKDGNPVREATQKWVREQWADCELGADVFITRLVEACGAQLGRAPETLLQEALQPLVDCCAAAQAAGRGGRGTPAAEVPAEDVAGALASLDRLMGRPSEDNGAEQRGQLGQALCEAAESLTQQWGQLLAELPVRLIEEPDFRLAGAEEAVRQLVAAIEQVLQVHEPMLKDAAGRARDGHGRLRALAAGPGRGARKPGPPAAEVLQQVRAYAKARYQTLVLTQVTGAFVTLRGHLADEMHEVNFCRVRLGELLRMFQAPAPPGPARPQALPAGCRHLAGAAQELLPAVGPESLRMLDGQVQEVLRGQFRALVQICLAQANILPRVHQAVLQAARDFVAGLLPPADVAKMFLGQYRDAAQARAELANAFEEAAPARLWQNGPAGPERGVTLGVLAAPPGPSGDRLRELARAALSEVDLHTVVNAPNPEDAVVLYRELSNLPLTDLDLLGPAGREACTQLSGEDFTPHSRTDIDFTLPARNDER
jgi:hypothetical protein